MTSKSKEEILIPWTKNGIPWKCSKGVESISYYNFVNRVSVRDEKIVWKPNKPFDGAFQIIELVPGSDYCQLVLRNSENGQSFYIRDKDFIEAIKKNSYCLWSHYRKMGGEANKRRVLWFEIGRYLNAKTVQKDGKCSMNLICAYIIQVQLHQECANGSCHRCRILRR